eukprot:7964184-Prorocentrum_lima.AAC.1
MVQTTCSIQAKSGCGCLRGRQSAVAICRPAGPKGLPVRSTAMADGVGRALGREEKRRQAMVVTMSMSVLGGGVSVRLPVRGPRERGCRGCWRRPSPNWPWGFRALALGTEIPDQASLRRAASLAVA